MSRTLKAQTAKNKPLWGKPDFFCSAFNQPLKPQFGAGNFIITLSPPNPKLSQLIKSTFDHRFLNKDILFFKTNPATIENIARFGIKILQKHNSSSTLYIKQAFGGSAIGNLKQGISVIYQFYFTNPNAPNLGQKLLRALFYGPLCETTGYIVQPQKIRLEGRKILQSIPKDPKATSQKLLAWLKKQFSEHFDDFELMLFDL